MACDIITTDSLFEELSRRFKNLNQHSEKNGVVLHFKGRRPGASGCGCCGETAGIHEYIERTVHAGQINGIPIYYRFTQIRFKCPACGRTFNEEIAGLDSRRRISKGMERFIMESLGSSTMSEISRQTGISVASVADIARQYSERMKSDIVSGKFTCLSMDELYISNKTDTAIPNADVCIDPFHVAENASKALNDIRKSTDFGSKEDNKKAKKDSYLSASSLFKLSGAELDRLESYLGKSDVLANAYFSYQEILYFYKIEGYNEATDYILNWIIDTSELNIPALNKVVATISKWLDEILNHFKHHISNGKTEGKNRLIRMIERMGFHYGHKSMQAAIYAHDARQAKFRKYSHKNEYIKEAVANSSEKVAA
ncbi:MAG: transposase [Clostridiales bacterium]|jgi:transposase|nr:transposase [Clostridiales bacterium]